MSESLLQYSGRDERWGLLGMRERALAIGGTLECWGTQGAGTEILATVPARRAYSKPGSNLRSIIARMLSRSD